MAGKRPGPGLCCKSCGAADVRLQRERPFDRDREMAGIGRQPPVRKSIPGRYRRSSDWSRQCPLSALAVVPTRRWERLKLVDCRRNRTPSRGTFLPLPMDCGTAALIRSRRSTLPRPADFSELRRLDRKRSGGFVAARTQRRTFGTLCSVPNPFSPQAFMLQLAGAFYDLATERRWFGYRRLGYLLARTHEAQRQIARSRLFGRDPRLYSRSSYGGVIGMWPTVCGDARPTSVGPRPPRIRGSFTPGDRVRLEPTQRRGAGPNVMGERVD